MTISRTVFAIIDASEADLGHVQEAVSELARQSISEVGCLRYDVYQSRKNPVRLINHELWTDDTALERHRASCHIARFKAKLDGTTAAVWASHCERLEEATDRYQEPEAI
jgi:quinol monooxygenase YgiN